MAGVIGVIMILADRSERRLAHALATVPRLTCAELLTGPLPKRVLVEGRAVPGPDGPLVAPLSGEPCVWARTEAEARINSSEYGRRITAWSHEQPNRFRIKDSTGSVMVSASLLRGAMHDYYVQALKGSVKDSMSFDPPEEPVPAGSIVSVPPDTQPCRDSRQAVTRLRARGMAYGRMAKTPNDPFWMSEHYLVAGRPMTVLAKPVRVEAGVELRAPLVGYAGAVSPRPAELRAIADKNIADNIGFPRHFLKFAAWLVGAAAVFQLLGWLSS
jgi:hypothetical protein